MSLWEYKVITSGKGGFVSPALMEKFLNDLGRDEWEIIHYQTPPDNALAFTGLARRSTQRDWTLQDAAAAAAKTEAEKLRAEFEAKFKAASSNGPAGGQAAEDKTPSFLEEKSAPDDGFRKPVDTSRDDDPDAPDEPKDDWDKLTATENEELPTFFDAIKPHLRRNQRGAGMSVGVDYLAKKWDQAEEDLKGALAECGFVMPVDEDSKAEFLEYDGDLYWLNINRRGELWINTKEKPRPVFRAVKGQRVESAEEPKAEPGARSPEPGDGKPEMGDKAVERATFAPSRSENREAKSESPGEPLPASPALLDKIRPLMRRNRRGPGGSGSGSFLSRALKCSEADLMTAFAALGLVLPATPADKPVFVEFGNELWWLNQDSRGGLWINGREKKDGETAAQAKEAEPAPTQASEAAASATAPSTEVAPASPLAALRLILKETKTGAYAGKVERLAETIGQASDQLLATLTGAGLVVPEKPKDKPVFIEHAGEIFWLNKNAKGELWLNAKASKFAEKKDGDEGKPRRPGRSRGKKSE
ncbi:MAG: hypothetical protein EXS32_12345 [Opitutus sp.]|nr:hypothetical protein [Opitutus sp.]